MQNYKIIDCHILVTQIYKDQNIILYTCISVYCIYVFAISSCTVNHLVYINVVLHLQLLGNSLLIIRSHSDILLWERESWIMNQMQCIYSLGIYKFLISILKYMRGICNMYIYIISSFELAKHIYDIINIISIISI